MASFDPQTGPKPIGFDRTRLSSESDWIAKRSREFAETLNYTFVGTQHLLLAIIEHDFTINEKILPGFTPTTMAVKRTMLEIAPPRHALHKSILSTTKGTWKTYTHAIARAREDSRLATPTDLMDGLFRYREPPVDSILKIHGFRISKGYELECLPESPPSNAE